MKLERRLALLLLPFTIMAVTSLACLGTSTLTTALTLYTEVIDDGKTSDDDLAARQGRAEVYITQESWDAALADLNVILTAQPTNADALAQRGLVNLKLKHFKEAIADLKAGLEGKIAANKADLDSKQNLSDAYYDLANQQGDLGDYQGAVDSYTAALDYTDDTDTRADIYAQRGFNYSEIGNTDAAMADYNTAIETKPDLAIAYAYRSNAQSDLGNDDAAISDANKALELGSELSASMRSSLLHARALAYLNQGDYPACITDATESISLIEAEDPADTARTYNIRASCNLYNDAITDAITDASAAIELGSEDITALPLFYAKRARAYWYDNQLDNALVDVNASLELNDTDASVFNLRGDIYYDQENYTEAATNYESAINLAPDDVLYTSNLGYAYRNSENYEAALNAFTQAIKIDGSYATAWIGRGMTHYLLGNDSEARADLETALTLDISDSDRDFINSKLSEIP
jgi:tetratricopeptide (TPR) repeat protein